MGPQINALQLMQKNGTGIQRCATFWRRRSYRYEFTDCLSSASEVDNLSTCQENVSSSSSNAFIFIIIIIRTSLVSVAAGVAAAIDNV